MPLDLTKPLNVRDRARAPAVLSKIQGNILKGHGRKFSSGLFVVLPWKRDDASRLIAELADYVTSAKEQWDESRKRHEARENGGEEPSERTFMMMALSGRCYDRLALKKFGYPEQPPDRSDRAAFEVFEKGMKASSGGGYAGWRPDTSSWELRLSSDFDLFLLIAHDSKKELMHEVRSIRRILATENDLDPARQIEEEFGRRSARESDLQKEKNVPAIEHFGYVDGISQPAFLTTNPKASQTDVEASQTDKAPLGRTILWAENPSKEDENAPTSYGSFLSVLKLEQNVRAFQESARELQAALRLRTPEEAEALAVGREKDGTPLIRTVVGKKLPPPGVRMKEPLTAVRLDERQPLIPVDDGDPVILEVEGKPLIRRFVEYDDNEKRIKDGKPVIGKVKITDLEEREVEGEFEEDPGIWKVKGERVKLGPNDFDYQDDPLITGFGAKQCPMSAHIRRMNPRRVATSLTIARRGFHYGPSWRDNPVADAPSGQVGLMFLGLASSVRPFRSLMGAMGVRPGTWVTE